MITFICWKWAPAGYRTTYTAEHVNIWAAGIRRHFRAEHRLICVTDDPTGVEIETFPLWTDFSHLKNPNGDHLPSCYRRLKMFSGFQTAEMDIEEGMYVVSIDLDVVFVNDLRPLFLGKKVDYIGWKGPGTYHPVVYNGTLIMFKAGRCEWLWKNFDPMTSPVQARTAKFFGSDQGYLSYQLKGRVPGFNQRDGVLSYTRDIHGTRNHLPQMARIVSFNGKHKPWDARVQAMSPWIKDHWRL